MDDNSKLNVIKNESNNIDILESKDSYQYCKEKPEFDSNFDDYNESNFKKLKIEIPDITLSLDDLEKNINNVFDDSDLSILEKSKKLTEFKKYVKQEQDKINFMIDKVSEISPKKSKKFKSLSLDDLVTLFEQEEDINNKIKIYQNICYSINKFKSKIFDIDKIDE